MQEYEWSLEHIEHTTCYDSNIFYILFWLSNYHIDEILLKQKQMKEKSIVCILCMYIYLVLPEHWAIHSRCNSTKITQNTCLNNIEKNKNNWWIRMVFYILYIFYISVYALYLWNVFYSLSDLPFIKYNLYNAFLNMHFVQCFLVYILAAIS